MRAIFMMGGPAAGKTTVRKREYDLPALNAIIVDSDAIKAEHSEYDPRDPSRVHAWSSQEATRRFYAAIGTGADVVFDGTGNSAEKYVTFIHAAQASGYETELVYVTCDLHEALRRNAARERVVAEDVVRERHATVATSFEIVSGYVDRVRVVRN